MDLAYIPSPGFSTITIGPVTIRMYAIMILLAIIAAVWVSTIRWKKVGGDFDQILDITIVAVPCGIIGARLYHVITTPERFFGPNGNPADIVRIWQGGLGIWGGVLLGALGAWAWCRHRHYPFALILDAAAPALLIAQAIGRLGNWFNQELYGSPTTLPWGLKLNPNVPGVIGSNEMCYDGQVCPSDTLFHPTFLYEMIWNLIGAALLVWLGRKMINRFKAGCLFCCYVMWYTLGRAWIENLRIDFAHEFLGVRVNVWMSIIVFILGVVAFMLVQRYGQPTAVLSDRLFEITRAEEKARSDSEQEAARRQRERDQHTGHENRGDDGADRADGAQDADGAAPSGASVSDDAVSSDDGAADVADDAVDGAPSSSLWDAPEATEHDAQDAFDRLAAQGADDTEDASADGADDADASDDATDDTAGRAAED